MDAELERLLERRRVKVQAYERLVDLDRRQRMSPETLQEHIIDRARVVFRALEARLGAWAEGLQPLGADVKLLWLEEGASSQTPAHCQVTAIESALEERRTHLLELTFTGAPDSEVVYSSARGKVINGIQGRFSLYAPDAEEQAWRVVSRFITNALT